MLSLKFIAYLAGLFDSLLVSPTNRSYIQFKFVTAYDLFHLYVENRLNNLLLTFRQILYELVSKVDTVCL